VDYVAGLPQLVCEGGESRRLAEGMMEEEDLRQVDS